MSTEAQPAPDWLVKRMEHVTKQSPTLEDVDIQLKASARTTASPKCEECVHYMVHSRFFGSLCAKTRDHTRTARMDENLCGPSGQHYKSKDSK